MGGAIGRQRLEPVVEHDDRCIGRETRRGGRVGQDEGTGLAGDQGVDLVVLEAVVHRHERDAGPRRGEQRHREQRVVLADVHERLVTGEGRCAAPDELTEFAAGDGRLGGAEQDTIVEARFDHFDERCQMHAVNC